MAIIKLYNNQGRIRIRFVVKGKTYNLSQLGSYSSRIDIAIATTIAVRIEEDINGRFTDRFDPTLEKYICGSTTNIIPVKPIKPQPPDTLLKIWDLWVDTLGLSQATKSDHYHRARVMIVKNNPDITNGKWILSQNLSASTFNQRLRFYKNACNWAILENLIDENPYLGINNKKGDTKKTPPLSIDSVKLIIEGFNELYPDYTPLVSFLFLSGARISEGIGLQFKRIDFNNNELTLADTLATVPRQKGTVRKETKTGAITVIPLSVSLRTLLEGIPKGNPEDLVFSIKGKAIRIANYQNRWDRVLQHKGIPHVKCYSTRHTFSSIAAANGMALEDIAYLLGHTNTATTSRHYVSVVNRPTPPEMKLD